MAELPYLSTTVTDHLTATAHLSSEAMGAYEVLRLQYWFRQGPLPTDPEVLARLARAEPAVWKRVAPTVLNFFQLTETGWRHTALDALLADAKARSEKARNAANLKWSADAPGMRTHNQSKSGARARAKCSECSPSPSSPPPREERNEDPPNPQSTKPVDNSKTGPSGSTDLVCQHCGERYSNRPGRAVKECLSKSCPTWAHPELGQMFVKPEDYVPREGAQP